MTEKLDEFEESAAVQFALSVSSFSKVEMISKRQKNGNLAYAFPEPSLSKQEAYIIRMIERDKKFNY